VPYLFETLMFTCGYIKTFFILALDFILFHYSQQHFAIDFVIKTRWFFWSRN